LEFRRILFKKGIQGSDWMATLCSSLLLGLDFNMPSQTQVLILAVSFGQVKYQKFAGKEKVLVAKL
jgi:hypothetical protein